MARRRATERVPPHSIIWWRLKQRQVVPFLGAGASLAHLATGPRWAPDSSRLPSGGELAEYLADESIFPSRKGQDRRDLARVSSYFVARSSNRRDVLRDRLRQILNRKHQPGSLHRLLTKLPAPLCIVTTNYDTLIERAFEDAGRPYDLVIYPSDRRQDRSNELLYWRHDSEPDFLIPRNFDVAGLETPDRAVILKMHGSIVPSDWTATRGLTDRPDALDSFVITEEDYVEFLARMATQAAIPQAFLEFFRNRCFLFLGYSLRDWNLRVLLHQLKQQALIATRDPDREPVTTDPPMESWAILRKVDPVERALWEYRGVRIFEEALEQFAESMLKQAAS